MAGIERWREMQEARRLMEAPAGSHAGEGFQLLLCEQVLSLFLNAAIGLIRKRLIQNPNERGKESGQQMARKTREGYRQIGRGQIIRAEAWTQEGCRVRR